MRLSFFGLYLWAAIVPAAEPEWRTSWDGTLYGYANHTTLRDGGILNPGNQLARLPLRSGTGELRLNARAENETLRLTMRAIANWRESSNTFGTRQSDDAYLSQWQLRVRAAENWHVSVGRDVLNWGAAQFRSPASPFYFDNGRSDPMRELTGMDSLKLSWTPDMQSSVSLVRVFGSGHTMAQPDIWRDSWLAKLDYREDDWALGFVVLKAPEVDVFYAAHGQVTLNDALLFYGEISSSQRPQFLRSPSDKAQAFSVLAVSPRRVSGLLGAAYTFGNGQSLAVEYLQEGHGYSAAQEEAYFQRAIAQPALALGLAPRLLGRDYLHLVWQTNPMEEQGYGRLMYTRSLTDGSAEYAGYGEYSLTPRLSLYALAVLPEGNARQEFSALLQRSLTLGLKIALP